MSMLSGTILSCVRSPSALRTLAVTQVVHMGSVVASEVNTGNEEGEGGEGAGRGGRVERIERSEKVERVERVVRSVLQL